MMIKATVVIAERVVVVDKADETVARVDVEMVEAFTIILVVEEGEEVGDRLRKVIAGQRVTQESQKLQPLRQMRHRSRLERSNRLRSEKVLFLRLITENIRHRNVCSMAAIERCEGRADLFCPGVGNGEIGEMVSKIVNVFARAMDLDSIKATRKEC